MTQIGFFNPVHPWTVQVLGDAGSDYLSRLEPSALAQLSASLRRRGMTTLIVARGGTLADEAPWRAAGIALERRDAPAHDIVHALRTAQAERAAIRQVVHGVLLDIHGVGVLLTGAAASGKSTLALELVTRGHRLVADDAVELTRPAPGIVVGHCPELLRGYVATRDLGVVDVARMHGPRAVLKRRRVDLVVRLAPAPRRADARQLLAGRRGTRRLLGEPLPAVTLPVHSRGARTGHNLAALVEAACLDWRLREDGIEADAALARRQARVIAKKK
jgi:HPr kinase/phosphorylase